MLLQVYDETPKDLHIEDEEVNKFWRYMLKENIAHLHVLQASKVIHGQEQTGVGPLLEPWLFTYSDITWKIGKR